jgi:hypothetical protein
MPRRDALFVLTCLCVCGRVCACVVVCVHVCVCVRMCAPPPLSRYIDRLPPPSDTSLSGVGGGKFHNHCQLLRLCPYFRGRHSTDEICWREGMEQHALMQLIREYPKLLAASLRTLPL